MRVRVTRTRRGDIDGIDLLSFRKGVTYDVSPSLGTYLVTTASADLVEDDEPLPEKSISEIRFTAAVQTFNDVAAEKGRARRKLLR